jgi:hypothetical protein
LFTLLWIVFFFLPDDLIVLNLHPAHSNEFLINHEPQDVRNVAFKGLFWKLNSFDYGLTFEQVPQRIDNIRTGGLNLPVSGNSIIIRHIKSNVSPFNLCDFDNSLIINREFIKFASFLRLKLCESRVDPISNLAKMFFALSFEQVPGKLRVEIGHKTFDLNLKGIPILVYSENLDNGDLFVLF